MPLYIYKAKTSAGEDRSGEVAAENVSKVAHILRQEGLILISAQKKNERRKRLDLAIPLFNKVSLTEKLMFTRNLRVMISAGLPLLRSLEILAEQTKNKKFKEAINDVGERIKKGESLFESLSNHKNIFPDLFLSMVRVGEKGGTLENSLEVLSRQMERQYQLESEIKGALVYPAVIILAMIGIGVAMLVFVIPKISETFKELGTKLPATTRFVIGLGDAMRNYWYLILGGIVVFGVLFRYVLQTKKAKKIIGILTFKAPLISSFLKEINTAYTLRSFSSLISAGVSLSESLGIMAQTSSNVRYQQGLKSAIKEVEKGNKLSAILAEKEIYPLLVTEMLAVGEETGQTAQILDKLADFFEARVTRKMKNMASVIEPVIMLLVGGAVGFFAISMIQPMYSMLGAIK